MATTAEMSDPTYFMQKSYDDARLESALRMRKLERPDAPPIVPEALTKQERDALIREQEAKVRRYLKEYGDRRCKELEASLERMKTAPPPTEEETYRKSKDGAERNYARFREGWNSAWGYQHGSFQDTTSIPPMCFTDNPVPDYTEHASTLQIFSFKVAGVSGGLQWPLDVFGIVSVRDQLDHNRNVIFERSRDNCQTLTEQDPHLVLTGPIRAPLCVCGPVTFDALLKVKGATEYEDKPLCLLAIPYTCCQSFCDSCVSSRTCTSMLNTLELTCGIVNSSVEATITMRVVEGSWPDGLRGCFTAWIASLDHMKVLLLDSKDDKVPVAAMDGTVELSRRVVSVEKYRKLVISVAALRGRDKEVAMCEMIPQEKGRSHDTLEFGFCKMEVEVAWSLFPKYYDPVELFPASKVSGEATASRASTKPV